MDSAILVMTKAPRSGEVKTRLVPPLTEEEAAALAACFIRDVVARAELIAAQIVIAYTPADGRSGLQELVPAGAQWRVQEGAELGTRQEHVITQAAALGYGPLVVIGTDSPTLPCSHLSAAMGLLKRRIADVVLGPTTDGGYCLLGLRCPAPGLLVGCQPEPAIAWSTSEVCEQVAARAERMKLRCVRLAPWYDVDTPADLERLWRELLGCPNARRRAPATFCWLQTAAGRLGLPG